MESIYTSEIYLLAKCMRNQCLYSFARFEGKITFQRGLLPTTSSKIDDENIGLK